jgi:hypothetical protein
MCRLAMQCADVFFSKRWSPLLLISVVTALVWGHTLNFGFVWDDRTFIQELESIRSLKSVPEMFYSLDAQSSRPKSFKLFRPLRTVHYALLYQLSGGREPAPALYHGANLIWHAGAAMLLYSVSLLLFRQLLTDASERRRHVLALFTAMAFAVHPVVSEVVAWSKSLDDAMAVLFVLASMRVLLRTENLDQRSYFLALIWFLLAVYSKISAVPFPIIVFLVLYQVRKFSFRRAMKLTSGFWAVALIFMVHRHLVIGQSNQAVPLSGSYGQTLIDMFPVAPGYLRLLFGIPPFCIDYSFMPGHHSMLSLPVIAGITILAVAVVIGWLSSRHRRSILVAFGLAWIGAFLLPVSNLLPMMQYMAERFLYLPIIGWLFVLAFVLHRVQRWQISVTLAASAIVAWSALAWDRSLIWRDELTLFVTTSRQHPGIRRVESNAIVAIFELPHVRAMFTFDKGESVGMIENSSPDQRAVVRETLTEAHQLFPRNALIASSLGTLHALTGRPAEAMRLFKVATEQNTNQVRTWSNLGRAAMDANAWTEAQAAISQALSLAPDDLESLKTASSLAWKMQNYQNAKDYLIKLQRLEPNVSEHIRWLHEAEARLSSSNQPGITPIQ